MRKIKKPDIAAASIGLIRSVNSPLEIERRALLEYILINEGLNFPLGFKNEIIKMQRRDGGWSNVRESVFCAALCRHHSSLQSCYRSACSWLLKIRQGNGGWGRTERDVSRIPITGLLMFILPELADKKAVEWLKREWAKDFSRSTRLTYKGGFFLMGLSASKIIVGDCPLIQDTVLYLAEEQNKDGGFGPWKDHPIGSDPWSTGIELLGLLSYPELVKRDVIENAVNWLAETQLPNGLWPYHYIEEGSAYAYWGLVEALKYLSKDSR